jgi:hypothetical protein
MGAKLMSKIDPRIIHTDQRKRDVRRDAWDRDYMGYYYLREHPKSDKRIENAKPVFIFAFFYVAILIMIDSMG